MVTEYHRRRLPRVVAVVVYDSSSLNKRGVDGKYRGIGCCCLIQYSIALAEYGESERAKRGRVGSFE